MHLLSAGSEQSIQRRSERKTKLAGCGHRIAKCGLTRRALIRETRGRLLSEQSSALVILIPPRAWKRGADDDGHFTPSDRGTIRSHSDRNDNCSRSAGLGAKKTHADADTDSDANSKSNTDA